MEKDKTIIRVVKNRDNPYVMVDRSVFECSDLSWKAKGLIGYLLSRPDDWIVRVGDLTKRGRDGRDAVYSGLRELMEYGYIDRTIERDDKGRIITWEYHVYEKPIERPAKPEPNPLLAENPEVVEESSDPLPGFPDQANPLPGSPDLANPTLLNTKVTKEGHLPITDHTHTDRTEITQRVCVEETPSDDINTLKMRLDDVGVRLADTKLRALIDHYGLSYLVSKIDTVLIPAVQSERRPVNPTAYYLAACQDDWKSSAPTSARGGHDGSRAGQGRFLVEQPGKYAKFYQLYAQTQTKND